MVGERGSQLSGGQRQRIAIARALVRDPSILILDEATSALDYATEASLLTTLRTVTQGRTVIQVTHRLASVIDADRIVLLDHGKVVEEGMHQDLIERGGLYAESTASIRDDGLFALFVNRYAAWMNELPLGLAHVDGSRAALDRLCRRQ